jgi:hypothetical protein
VLYGEGGDDFLHGGNAQDRPDGSGDTDRSHNLLTSTLHELEWLQARRGGATPCCLQRWRM